MSLNSTIEKLKKNDDLKKDYFKESILGYKDFYLIWYVIKDKIQNQKYFITCSLNEKALNFLNSYKLEKLLFLENQTISDFSELKDYIVKNIKSLDLTKFWFEKDNIQNENDISIEFEEELFDEDVIYKINNFSKWEFKKFEKMNSYIFDKIMFCFTSSISNFKEYSVIDKKTIYRPYLYLFVEKYAKDKKIITIDWFKHIKTDLNLHKYAINSPLLNMVHDLTDKELLEGEKIQKEYGYLQNLWLENFNKTFFNKFKVNFENVKKTYDGFKYEPLFWILLRNKIIKFFLEELDRTSKDFYDFNWEYDLDFAFKQELVFYQYYLYLFEQVLMKEDNFRVHKFPFWNIWCLWYTESEKQENLSKSLFQTADNIWMIKKLKYKKDFFSEEVFLDLYQNWTNFFIKDLYSWKRKSLKNPDFKV